MMKRGLAIMAVCAMTLALLSGCKSEETVPMKPVAPVTKASYELVNNDVINVTPTDVFGEHSIAILGDSMPHGSQTVDMYHNSWPNLVKAAINAKSGDNNHGFVSVEGTLWGKQISHDLHAFPESKQGFKERNQKGKGWTEYRTAELLGTKGLGSSVKDAELIFTVQETYTYFCVYYQTGAKYGSFEVRNTDGVALANENGETSISCVADEETYARTAFYKMSDLKENKIVLHVTTAEEVIFTGIGYYNTPGGVVVSNYSNGGLQLAGIGKAQDGNMTGLDTKFLDLAMTSGTVIFSLGYNDAYFTSDLDLFEEKIEYMIEKAKQNGVKVIVNDTVWSDPRKVDRIATVKGYLKRLADETGGIYLDQEAINGQALIATCEDGVHPNAEGHKMIAATILKALGLEDATA
ncbi:MAG: hypothetical protein IKV35_04925 [Clostridia bacterium]|nr:hypothetical protein [Clostridia bacterium]